MKSTFWYILIVQNNVHRWIQIRTLTVFFYIGIPITSLSDELHHTECNAECILTVFILCILKRRKFTSTNEFFSNLHCIKVKKDFIKRSSTNWDSPILYFLISKLSENKKKIYSTDSRRKNKFFQTNKFHYLAKFYDVYSGSVGRTFLLK